MAHITGEVEVIVPPSSLIPDNAPNYYFPDPEGNGSKVAVHYFDEGDTKVLDEYMTRLRSRGFHPFWIMGRECLVVAIPENEGDALNAMQQRGLDGLGSPWKSRGDLVDLL